MRSYKPYTPSVVVSIFILLVLICPVPSWADYAIADLAFISPGGLPTSSSGYGINNNGQATGMGVTPFSGPNRAFLYSNGTMTDLGAPSGTSHSAGNAINDNGQVVGYGFNRGGLGSTAFLYSNGAMTSLGWGSFGVAYGINNSAQVVGSGSTTQDYFAPVHALLYSNGATTDLGTLGGTSSTAYAINDSGQIVGISSLATNGVSHAFLYNNGSMQDLGTLGGTYSSAFGINANGLVVGSSTTVADAMHAFLYNNGTMTDLGLLAGMSSSRANGINGNGQIVGNSSDAAGNSRAFLYSNGSIIDLNALLAADSGWTLQSASAINEAGQIVGTGIINGEQHAFLMTPVPVPAAILLFVSGLLPLGWVAGKKRMNG